MRLIGAQPAANLEGVSPLPGRINRLIGSVQDWRQNSLRFGSVRYRDVYPGIDLVFHGDGQKLEYDFVVRPGADPSVIQVQWMGARKLSLNGQGDLTITAREGEIHWNAPVLYQMSHGVRTRVDGGFKLLGHQRAGFRVGAYNHGVKLVIDPSLSFSTYLGGSLYDIARAIATDSSGNVYVAGSSKSIDLAVTRNAAQTAYAGNTFNLGSGDGFIAKYSSAGVLIYLTYLGGSKDDLATAIAVDAAGNAYVTGYTSSTDFPVTSGAYQRTYRGAAGNSFSQIGDAFVTKLSPDGSSLVYSTYLGGSADDIGFGIAVDSSGNAYVTGTTLSGSFPTTSGAFQSTYRGSGTQAIFPRYGASALIAGDVFVTKLDPAGSRLIYSTFLGGVYDDCAMAIAVDGGGNAYIGGYTLSSDFPVTSGAFQRSPRGRERQNRYFNFGDAFAAKLDPSGANLLFSTYVGGSGDEQVTAITFDSSGNTYVTGFTTSPDFPTTPDAFQRSYKGPASLPFFVDQLFGDAFVTKISATGALLMSTYLGGGGDDVGYGIALDGSGNILIAGNSNSVDFPVTQDAIQRTLAGPGYSQSGNTQGDGFLAVLNPGGTAESYGTYFGGSLDDVFLGMTLSPSGTAYITGSTASTNYPTLRPAQSRRGGLTASGVSRADVIVTAISGFVPKNGVAGPTITQIVSVSGETTAISQNTWIEIKGTNLVPASTPAAGVIWNDAPEFRQGQMPTQLGGVSVTVNGKPAFIYFFCSVKTSSVCATDQIDVLTPLDSTIGTVQVQVTSGTGTASSTLQLQRYSPGFFQFEGGPYVAATHLDGSLVAPPTLFGGVGSPARPGELIVIYANGFGQISPAISNGSSTQSGSLPTTPAISIAGALASVQFAGAIAPGLYQFNVLVPAVPDGDALITATYNGFTTQSGALIPVRN